MNIFNRKKESTKSLKNTNLISDECLIESDEGVVIDDEGNKIKVKTSPVQKKLSEKNLRAENLSDIHIE